MAVLLPIGDSPNFRSTPWVTYALIASNVLVFVATLPLTFEAADPADAAARAYARVLAEERGVRVSQISAYDAVVFRYGFKPRFPALGDMLTSMFLHGGLWHLLGNMLFLWIYGDNVEHRLGRGAYLAAYLLAGLAASLGDGLLRPGSAIPSVGASGAISGVLGFYFIWFPKNRVRVWVFLFPLLMTVIEIPARIVLMIYVIVDNLLPALVSGGAGGVAYGAHLGGFGAAVVMALVLDRFSLRRPERVMRRPAPRPPRPADPVAVIRARLAGGDLPGALSGYLELPARASRAIDPGEVAGLASRLEDEGHLRAALAVLQRLGAEHPRGAGGDEAHLAIARILRQIGMPVEAYQVLVGVLERDPSARVRDEALAQLAELRRRGVVPRRFE